MTMQTESQDILDRLKTAQSKPLGDPRFRSLMGLEKSTFSESNSAGSGLTFYDLELGAKFLYPVMTPLRNSIPRVSGKGGIQASWRAITAINTTGLRFGVSSANRGGVLAVATQDYAANYKGIGVETSVDFEAQFAGQEFDDIRAIGAKTGLEALMIGEEAMILGGCSSAIAATPTPTLTAQATGGSLPAQTWSIVCAALTLDGLMNGSVAGGVQGSITRTNADGSTDTFGGGVAKKSANATVATTGAAGLVNATVAPVSGAMGYAWFWGAAGSEILGAITTINSLVITAAAAGTQTAASLGASDNSANALAFDGLIYQATKPGSGATLYTMGTGSAGVGVGLTTDSAGGVMEIDAVLKSMWDNYRLSPDTMWVSSQEALNISRIILKGSQTAAQRFVFETAQDLIGGGIMVRTYLNRFSMQGGNVIDIRVHPNMPAGTILLTTKTLPYPLAGVGNVIQIRTRQDYYQIEWPLRTRKYEYGVYSDQVLQNYFPPSMGLITNIGNV
ncbi:conserved hypothetical protein, putative phage associated protein [Methylocella silvestris BL2]|uniref:Uncharacterized protein n=1 Tax=Methylocella silvestris (strain DSM 15510 / CIP 108128 / LMG 27833 / NCIMB 13906 / BL2) TaxID=395965 RepID=B8EKS8_METSB|nr:hypothetical protein [Methylocella silvestris]ACK51956.1 conserved hypothetical protein, putative phage associated protein [Methylocella silvestris BL2]